MQILGGGALPRTYTTGNWPITALNSGVWRFVWTPTAANTDAAWDSGFYCVTASSGTPSGTDAGGLWITGDALELYNQTTAVFSQAMTWGAGAVITITINLVANTVTIAGASTGNGTFGFTDSGTYFTAGTLGVGIYGGGGFNIPSSTISAFDDTVPEPAYWTQPPVIVRRPSRAAALAAGIVMPLVVSAPPPTVPDLSWSPTFPAMVRRAEAAPNHGGLFAPDPLPQPNPAPPLSWAPTYPDQLARASLLQLADGTAPPADTTPPPAAPDQWSPIFPDVVRRAERSQDSCVFEALQDDGQPLLEWLPSYPSRFPPLRQTALGLVVAPPFDTSNPDPAPLGVAAYYPAKIPGHRRPANVGGSSYVGIATGEPLSIGIAAVRQRINALNPPTGTFTTYGTDAAITLVVNLTDTITSVGHTIITGDGPFYYRVSAGGTFPGNVDGVTPYYGIRITDDTLQLATSAALAVAGTQVNITSDGTGTHTLVRAVHSDLGGSAFLTFIARGAWATSPNAPTDSKGNTYTATPGSPRAYDGFASSQAGVYIDLTGVGGPNHTFSGTWGDIGGSGDEVTIAGVEVRGAKILQDASVVERVNGGSTIITSNPVTVTARARLVLFVAGNGPTGQDHTFTPLDGFVEVLGASAKGDISGNGYIQDHVFTKMVNTRGTYTARVQGTNQEGAQLFLIALQAVADEAPPMDWYVQHPDPVREVRRVSGDIVGPLVTPAPAVSIGWLPELPAAMPRRDRVVAGVEVGPLADTNAGPLTWQGSYPAAIDARARAPEAGAVAPPSDTNAGPLCWSPSYPDRIPVPRRAPAGGITAPPSDTNAGPLSWSPTFPDRARRALRAIDAGATAPPGLGVDPLSWSPIFPGQVAGHPYPMFGGEIAPPSDTNAGPLTWAPTFPDRASGVRRTIEGGATAPPGLGVDPLSWSPTAPGQLARRQRQFGGEVAPPSDTNAGPLTWSPVYPGQLKRARLIGGGETAPPFVPSAEPLIWSPDFPAMVEQLRRAVLGGDVGPLVVPPPLLWVVVYPDVVLARPRPVDVGGESRPELVQAAAPAPDLSWSPTFPHLVLRAAQPLNVGGLAVLPELAQPNPPAPPLSWSPTFPDSIRRARRGENIGGGVHPTAPPVNVLPPVSMLRRSMIRTTDRFTKAGSSTRWAALMDRANDLAARMGLRPYKVMIVHVRWTGARRGDGVEELVTAREILPSPEVADLSGITRELTLAQIDESGTVLITKISATYTEDQVLCRSTTGRPLAPNEAIFYEIQSPGGGERRRLVPVGTIAPTFNAVRGWSVTVTLQAGARPRGR